MVRLLSCGTPHGAESTFTVSPREAVSISHKPEPGSYLFSMKNVRARPASSVRETSGSRNPSPRIGWATSAFNFKVQSRVAVQRLAGGWAFHLWNKAQAFQIGLASHKKLGLTSGKGGGGRDGLQTPAD